MSDAFYRDAPLQTRHRMVYEIGDEGVARLCASEAAISLDGEAGEWAEDYLRRAGVSVTRRGASAARPASDPAAAALRGALTAVEVLKDTLGVGARGDVEEALAELARKD